MYLLRTKDSQSALEYMMTYGWAILIIVIVAAVLYSFGIFNPSSASNVPFQTTGLVGIPVTTASANSTLFNFVLSDEIGETIYIYNVSVTINSQVYKTSGCVGATLVPGEEVTCSVSGSFSGEVAANIIVYYNVTSSSQPTVVTSASGTVRTATISGPIGSSPSGPSQSKPTGIVFVQNSGDNTFSIINASSASVIAQVPIGADPINSLYDSYNNLLYVVATNAPIDNPTPIFGTPPSVTAQGSLLIINGTNYTSIIKVGRLPYGIAFDPANGYVYVANYISNTTYVISGSSIIANISTGYAPFSVLYDPTNGYVYVANYYSNTVSVISGTSIVGTVSQMSNPDAMAYNSKNGDVYVANFGNTNVSVISGTTLIANVKVYAGTGSAELDSISYDPKHNVVYTSSYIGYLRGSSDVSNVSVINATNNALLISLIVPSGPLHLTFDPNNNFTYSTDYNSANISVLNVTRNLANISVIVNGAPNQIAYDPANKYMYASVFGSNIYKIYSTTISTTLTAPTTTINSFSYDSASQKLYLTSSYASLTPIVFTINSTDGIANNIPAQHFLQGTPSMAYDNATKLLYFGNILGVGGSVSILNTSSYKILKITKAAGNSSDWGFSYANYLVFDSSNHYVYVSNPIANTTTVFDGLSSIANISTGYSPYYTVFDPYNGYVYVSDYYQNDTFILSGTSLVKEIATCQFPSSAVVDTQNGYVYEICNNMTSIISGTTVLKNITVPGEPTEGAFDPNNGYVYIAGQYSNTTYVISGTSFIKNITVPQYPLVIGFSPSNGYIYTENENVSLSFPSLGSFSVIDGISSLSNVSFNENNAPAFIDYINASKEMYMSDGNSIAVINGTSISSYFAAIGSSPVAVLETK